MPGSIQSTGNWAFEPNLNSSGLVQIPPTGNPVAATNLINYPNPFMNPPLVQPANSASNNLFGSLINQADSQWSLNSGINGTGFPAATTNLWN